VAPAEPAKTDSLEKRLTWLDDQRRKDAELLRKLASQLKAAEDLVGKHNRQLQEFSAELSRLGAVAAKIQGVDDTLSKHRQEVSRQLESAETRRAEREKSLEQLRRKDHDEVAKGIAEVRQEMSGLVDLRREFDARRDEEVRLARSVGALAERLDSLAEGQQGQEQAMVGHEDSHKQEARRSADLQSEVTDLRYRRGSDPSARYSFGRVQRRRGRTARVHRIVDGESESPDGGPGAGLGRVRAPLRGL